MHVPFKLPSPCRVYCNALGFFDAWKLLYELDRIIDAIVLLILIF